MRILRLSMYGPDLEPLSMVVPEDSITVSLEEALEQQRVLPGGFVAWDIFELESGEIVDATLEAERRREAVDTEERNAAMLYHWNAGALRNVVPTGVLSGTRPAPLSVELVARALEQLASHPNYEHQSVTTIAEDGTVLTMRDGEVTALR